MRGKRKGMKKRYSDGRRSGEFRRWTRHRREKLIHGDRAEKARIDLASKRAADQLEQIKAGADNFASDLEEAAKQFTKEELRKLRNKEPFTEEMIGKMLDRILHLAMRFFEALGHPLPCWEELMHTYVFRFAICACMHALRWIAVGGARKVGRERIRNDIIDASIAAYALCFDGILTKDDMAQEVYDNAQFILKQYLAFRPPANGVTQPPQQALSPSLT
jgi:hypothetical protein